MKTVLLSIRIIIVAILTLSGGLVAAQNTPAPDLNMATFIDSEDDVLFYTAQYNVDNGGTIHWVNHLPGMYIPSVSAENVITPQLSRTYFAKEVIASYEDLPVLESWMTTPFKSSLEEPDLGIEEWMVTPFESRFANDETELGEEELEVESWMTSEWL